MIGEVIKKPGEKGSGGDASAFAPGIHYICFKATKTAMLNIASNEWNDAAQEMRLTSELNNRVDLPPEAPSFIPRVCGFGFHILRRQFGQARRARCPQIAQALDARQQVFHSQEMNAA